MKNTEYDPSVPYLLVMSSDNTLLSESFTILGSKLRKCHPRMLPKSVLAARISNILKYKTSPVKSLSLKHSQSYFSSTSSLYRTIYWIPCHQQWFFLLLLLLKYSWDTITMTPLKVTRWNLSLGKFCSLGYKGLSYIYGQVKFLLFLKSSSSRGSDSLLG